MDRGDNLKQNGKTGHDYLTDGLETSGKFVGCFGTAQDMGTAALLPDRARREKGREEDTTMGLILLILLILLLLGGLPTWPYSRAWGYYPSGITGLLLIILIILLLMSVIPFGF